MAKATSIHDRIKEMESETERMKEAAKIVASVEDAISALKELGFTYKLVEGGRSTNTGKGTVSNKPCPVCKFLTSPPHDRRAHRQRDYPKKPFTAAELKELGLTKVE